MGVTHCPDNESCDLFVVPSIVSIIRLKDSIIDVHFVCYCEWEEGMGK